MEAESLYVLSKLSWTDGGGHNADMAAFPSNDLNNFSTECVAGPSTLLHVRNVEHDR